MEQDKSAGFSVVEMLVALAITALLMAMLPGTLRLGKRAWQTGESGAESASAAALSFVRDRLAGAVPIYAGDGSGLTSIAFTGGPHSVDFISEVGSGPRGGGLYRIFLGPDAGGKPSLQLALFRADATSRSVADQSRDLSAGVSSVGLRYFGTGLAATTAQWHESWSRTDRLPDLVEITPVSATGHPLPASIVELRLRPK